MCRKRCSPSFSSLLTNSYYCSNTYIISTIIAAILPELNSFNMFNSRLAVRAMRIQNVRKFTGENANCTNLKLFFTTNLCRRHVQLGRWYRWTTWPRKNLNGSIDIHTSLLRLFGVDFLNIWRNHLSTSRASPPEEQLKVY